MNQIIGWTLYLAFVAAILVFGWERPLKVQFGLNQSTPSAVTAESGAAQPDWMNNGRRWDTARNAAPAPQPTPSAAKPSQP